MPFSVQSVPLDMESRELEVPKVLSDEARTVSPSAASNL